MPYGVVFVLAVAMAFGATLAVRRIAKRAGVVDEADGFRKLHSGGMPLLGGVGVFAGFCGSILLVRAFIPAADVAGSMAGRDFATVFAGGAAALALGLIDDIRGMRARWKLVGMVLISLGMYYAGFRIESVSNPFGQPIPLGPLALPVTLFWFLGFMNAVNLIDGLDGLAAGTVFFAASTVLLAGLAFANASASLMAAALAGACIGFLLLNFYPASIYLGDCGSLVLGFLLASIGLRGAQKSQMVVAVLIPVIAFGLPIMDTSLAILRRWLKSVSFFSSDHQHIHHKLLEMGFDHRSTVLIMYGGCLVLAWLALLMAASNSTGAAALLLVLGALTVLAVRTIGRHEYALLKEKVGSYVDLHWRGEVRAAANIASGTMRNAHSAEALWDSLSEVAEVMALEAMDLSLVDAPGGSGGGRTGADAGDHRAGRRFHWRNGHNGHSRSDVHWTAVFPLQADGNWLGRLWVQKFTNGRPLAREIPESLQLLAKAFALNAYRLDHPESGAGPDAAAPPVRESAATVTPPPGN